jgi:hypothetical protein
MSYTSGKAYRANLGARPKVSSTPESRERGEMPVTRHRTPPQRHVETVGWMDGEFHHRTTPNADNKTGTDRFYRKPVETRRYRRSDLNTVKMKPTS